MFRLKLTTGLTVALLAIVVVSEELYSARYDYINPHEIVGNERLRKQYYNCFIGASPCITPEAKFFKGNFPEVILTQCRKCTEKQKENLNILTEWYTEHRPEDWKALIAKFIKDAQKMNIKS